MSGGEHGSVSAPYWEATRRRELVLQWCPDCDVGIHYPRAVCPRCGQSELCWRPSSGTGTVYAHAHHPEPGGAGYVVALVDLDEGVRLLSRIVGCRPEDVAVGMSVDLSWLPLDDGRALPVFAPFPETAPGGRDSQEVDSRCRSTLPPP